MPEVVVLDASAVVDALVNGANLPHSALVAPAHLDAEVLSALGRLHRHAVLTAPEVEELLDDLAAMPVQRVALVGLTAAAFALRQNVALRDALYVVVAQAMDAPLHTCDEALARACTDQGLCAVLAA